MSFWLQVHRMFGPIRRFQYLEKDAYICFLRASGFTKEDLHVSFTPNELIQVVGEKKLYEETQMIKILELDELIHLPPRMHKPSFRWEVQHGMVILRGRSTSLLDSDKA